jgi:energy-converting hydrogenase Eha subunit G
MGHGTPVTAPADEIISNEAIMPELQTITHIVFGGFAACFVGGAIAGLVMLFWSAAWWVW